MVLLIRLRGNVIWSMDLPVTCQKDIRFDVAAYPLVSEDYPVYRMAQDGWPVCAGYEKGSCGKYLAGAANGDGQSLACLRLF